MSGNKVQTGTDGEHIMTTRNTLTIKTALKAGGTYKQHNHTALALKTNVKAGGGKVNHNQSAR
jgi:hypothetical protein